MSAQRRDSSVSFVKDDLRARAGFRVVTADPLAGGPLELEFYAESSGTSPLRLAVAGDRMRQRPGLVEFSARVGSTTLSDPMEAIPYAGGPEGIVTVSTESPWRQPLLLNQFVRLEDTLRILKPGNTARMELSCRRPFPLATNDALAVALEGAPVLAVDLAFDLRRDDTALLALANGLLEKVMQAPPEGRERPLELLLSMRAAASVQITALIRHPDSSVANRAAICLGRT